MLLQPLDCCIDQIDDWMSRSYTSYNITGSNSSCQLSPGSESYNSLIFFFIRVLFLHEGSEETGQKVSFKIKLFTTDLSIISFNGQFLYLTIRQPKYSNDKLQVNVLKRKFFKFYQTVKIL